MVDGALMLSGVLMGLAGVPHCAAMCGASSAAVQQRCGGPHTAPAFQAGRLLGYAAVGAIAASSVSLLRLVGEAAPAIRPLWTLLHVAALALGLWLMVTGRQPDWMSQAGRTPPRLQGGWQRIQGPLRAGAVGTVWVAWPCGLLQSALIVAALATTPWAGALVMGGFAAASATGLWATGWLWARSLGRTQGGAPGRSGTLTAGTWVVRFSGLSLAAASGWALGHGLWERVAAFCLAS